MALNNNLPILPLRPSDANSQFLAKDLVLAYPMLEGGNTLKNYGTLGSQANLNLSNVTRVRQNGLTSLSFNGTTSLASNSSVNMLVPQKWSFAYWVKFNGSPSAETSLLTLQGPTEGHLRAWADGQGIWAWQKHSIADAYSILPTSDFPTNNTMLVIAVYDDPLLPPAQLRTNQGLTNHPSQPQSYTVFNEATGSPLTTVNSIYIGGGPGNSKLFNGVLGPVYVWSRPLSESEIWQLWQDPYAPFRRNTEQLVTPSTMVSSQGSSLQGIGKSTGSSPVISDNSALVIGIDDNLVERNYVNDGTSLINRFNDDLYINDYYNYQDVALDSLMTELTTPPEINIVDDYSYANIPNDQVIVNSSNIGIIDIQDSFQFVSVPTDSVLVESSGVSTVSINDDVAYVSEPGEQIII